MVLTLLSILMIVLLSGYMVLNTHKQKSRITGILWNDDCHEHWNDV